MMRGIVMLAVLAAQAAGQAPQPAQPQPQAPPNTEVYLVSLADPAAWSASSVSNISASPGYDNQPSFMRDSRSVLFTSNRDGRQSDIYRYWIADRKLTQLTETPESEYSPTVVPAGNGFSVIQVEADQAQRLWQFDLSGKSPQVVLADLKPIGYHAWIDGETLMVFVLGQPATLQRVTPGAVTGEVVAERIGRSLVPMLNGRAVSFTTRDENGAWWFNRYDADARAVTPLVQAPDGHVGEPYGAWTREGRLYSAAGTRIVSWKPGEAGWTTVGDLSAAPLRNISRLAVSPDGRWLAFVAEPASGQ